MDIPARDLAAIHGLLARVLLKEADTGLLRELARAEISGPLDALEPGFAAYVTPGAADLEEAAAEYARLFLLPRGVSPYAAAWQDGEEGAVRAHLEKAINELYEALRVRPADFGLGNVPSDHIGMLLALHAVALEREASGGLAAKCRALFAHWSPAFARRLLATTDCPLYRAAAHLLLASLDDGDGPAAPA